MYPISIARVKDEKTRIVLLTMVEEINRLKAEVEELKQRNQPRVIGHRHGVKDQFERAQNGEKPKIIS